MTEKLKNIISGLPDLPGVYQYYDEADQLIYIGKAKSLKKRVSSYFVKQSSHTRKTEVMVSKIRDIRITLVDSEYDALLLENALIKKHQPRYNINLKDDKTYPYLAILNERFPRLISTRNPVKNGTEYFGPYASGMMMHAILDLVRALYPLRTCSLLLSESNIREHKFRACLEAQIGNCKAPCVGGQDEIAYMEMIAQVKSILRGHLGEANKYLRSEMKQAATELRFEEAESYRRRISLLENYQSKSTIVSHTVGDIDVFAIISDERLAYINYLKVVNGIIIQTQSFEIKKKMDEPDAEILEMVIGETRSLYQSKSPEIIVPVQMDMSEPQLNFIVPKAGDKKKLLDLAMKNVLYFKRDKQARNEKLDPGLRTDRVLTQMQQDLRLKSLPRHIECFDNSNFQGAYPVSAMVVFKEAKASKKDYRHFNIKTVIGPDDFSTMREAVTRRYTRVIQEAQPLPDLIVIDGGKGQLSAAVESLKQLGLYGKVPVIGIAKRLEELFFPEDELPLFIDKKSETLKVIQQIRDEAHRFGITHHRSRRDKGTLQSELSDIPGIGEESVQLLLKEFKSVKKIATTTLNELTDLLGPSRAKKVYDYFHS